MSRKNIRLNSLIDELFNIQASPLPPGIDRTEARPTTIRPSAEVAHFFQFHAERLDISMQDMMMLGLKAIAEGSLRETEQTFQLVVDRFKILFEAHAIPQIHAKSVIDSCGLLTFPIGALTNDTILLEHFTPALRETLQRVFHVRAAWLDGVEDAAVLADPIYSRDHAFTVWESIQGPWPMRGMKLLGRELLVVRSNRRIAIVDDSEPGGETDYPELLLYTVRTIKLDRHMEFKSYELNGIYPTANIEARCCVQALLTIALQEGNDVRCNGISVNHDDYSAMKAGRLPALCLSSGYPTTWDVTALAATEVATGAETLSELLRISN